SPSDESVRGTRDIARMAHRERKGEPQDRCRCRASPGGSRRDEGRHQQPRLVLRVLEVRERTIRRTQGAPGGADGSRHGEMRQMWEAATTRLYHFSGSRSEILFAELRIVTTEQIVQVVEIRSRRAPS